MVVACRPAMRYNGGRMKLFSRITLFSLLLAAAATGLTPAAAAEKGAPQSGVVNRIAATVNGRPITSADVRAALAPRVRELMMLYPKQGPRFNSELVQAKKQVLDELIERELVLSEFANKGYVMKEDVVDDEINNRILHGFNGNREAFLKELRQSGMTYGEYRDSVRKSVTVSAMRSARYERGIPPTPDEIKEEYAATKSEYRDVMKDSVAYDKIYIPGEDPLRPEATPEDQLNLADELRTKLDKKEISFEEAARTYSRDAHAEDGGRWPELKRSELSPTFANVVFGAAPGQIVGPLLSPEGLTIVRVRAKHLAPAPPLSNPKVKQAVDDAVRRKQSEKRYREWVNRLHDKAIIRIFI